MESPATIQNDVDLTDYNTFGVSARAARYLAIQQPADLKPVVNGREPVQLVLGGGSNVLFTRDPEGLVIHNQIRGLEVQHQGDDRAEVIVGAGENWHELVVRTLEMGWYGLENLSLIPGTVGAAPIQNIGAYGLELSERFAWLEALELATGRLHIFRAADCSFGYRYSYFKDSGKGRFLITRVALELHRQPDLRLEYGAIREVLREWKITSPTPPDVSRAVIHIRQSKLPDPAELGNAGSFFKNPVLPEETFAQLRASYPAMPHYPQAAGIKVPAGWLIEQCGWKGKRVGRVGCHERQSLVIVNYGGATGEEVEAHARRVEDSVRERFGIQLDREVNIL